MDTSVHTGSPRIAKSYFGAAQETLCSPGFPAKLVEAAAGSPLGLSRIPCAFWDAIAHLHTDPVRVIHEFEFNFLNIYTMSKKLFQQVHRLVLAMARHKLCDLYPTA